MKDLSAEDIKNLGNEQYKNKNYEKAIDYYTKAIGMFIIINHFYLLTSNFRSISR